MKKLLVFVIAGIMIATILLMGCGFIKVKKVNEVDVDVEVETEAEKTEEKWVKYTYWSGKDSSDAYRCCKEGYYWHLDNGELVSEIYETSSPSGDTIYYFKAKVAG